MVSFDKAAPADISFSTQVSFASAPTSVVAEGLTEADYTISGQTITVKTGYLMGKQPGAGL